MRCGVKQRGSILTEHVVIILCLAICSIVATKSLGIEDNKSYLKVTQRLNAASLGGETVGTTPTTPGTDGSGPGSRLNFLTNNEPSTSETQKFNSSGEFGGETVGTRPAPSDDDSDENGDD